MGGNRRKVVFFISIISVVFSLSVTLFSDEVSPPSEEYPFEKDKSYFSVLYTSKGKIVCRLCPEKAPFTVTNFLHLAETGFYNGLSFHLVIPDYVIQSGSPNNRGDGGPGYTLPAEIELLHEAGSLACPRIPNEYNPYRRSNGSQFYITLDKITSLDGKDTVFGWVVEGFDVVKSISEGDCIDRIEIEIK